MCSGEKQYQTIEWTSQEDEILIDFVKSHECLYNVQCKDYRKSQLKQSIWKKLGGILGNKTDIECSKRWAYVRDYYIRRKGKSGIGSSREAAKKRAQQLLFLDSLSSGKISTLCNIEDSRKEENSSDYFGEKAGTAEEYLPIMKQPREEEGDEAEEAYNQNEHNSNNQQNISQDDNDKDVLKIPSAKHKYVSHCSTSNKYSEERMHILRQIAERLQRPHQEHELDVNDHFFAAMATTLKKLPEKKQAEIRLQIGTIVGRAEIEYLSISSKDDYYYRPSSASSSSIN